MAELKIIATIVVKEGYQDKMMNIFKKVVDETRKEAGVILYELHQDVKNPLKYTMVEIWKSEQAIDEHNKSPHFNEFVRAVDGKIDDLQVETIKKVY